MVLQYDKGVVLINNEILLRHYTSHVSYLIKQMVNVCLHTRGYLQFLCNLVILSVKIVVLIIFTF